MKREERKQAILKMLCNRGYDKIGNLAFELNVSEKTIRNDIYDLSKSYPIFTLKGKHYGGVYIDDNFQYVSYYPNKEQAEYINKLLKRLTDNERKITQSILTKYIPLNKACTSNTQSYALSESNNDY